jgi:hypothetical protein
MQTPILVRPKQPDNPPAACHELWKAQGLPERYLIAEAWLTAAGF